MAETTAKSSNELAEDRTDLAGKRSDLAAERTDLAHKRSVMAEGRTDLAVKRSVMAADRTLMAWTRTGLSMISFGITVYKFLEYIYNAESAIAISEAGPRRFGIIMLSLGVVSIALGIREYMVSVRGFDPGHSISIKRGAFFSACAVGLIGLALLVSTIARISLI